MWTKAMDVSARSVAGGLLYLGCCAANAQGFADDFSSTVVNPDFNLFTQSLANPDSVATVDESGLLLDIVHADPAGGERAVYELSSRRATDSVSSTGQFLGERPAVGTLRYETQGRFYNSLMDGGFGEDERTGDVEIEIELVMGPSPEQDFAEVCFKDRDAEGNSQPLEPSRNTCEPFQISGLELDTPYTIEVGIDRATQELYGVLDDERIAVASPTPFNEPADRRSWARFRVRDGAESGAFRMSELSFDGTPVNFSSTEAQDRYRLGDFDDFRGDDDRSKAVVDGRLRLSATVADPEGEGDAFLRFAEANDYIEADLVFSSESSVDTSAGGFAAVRLSGLLYNEISSDPDAGFLGSVFASVMLIDNAGSGLVGEYCLVRSDADDFSESTDLADGMNDDRCPTFDLTVSPDTVYNASLSLDREAGTVTFGLGGEVRMFDITTDVFKREDDLLRAQVRMSSGTTGTVVGYFDNLRNDPDALTDEELAGSVTDGTPTTGGMPTTDGGDAVGASNGGGSGGGCSIGQGDREHSLFLLLFAALVGASWRRSARRRG